MTEPHDPQPTTSAPLQPAGAPAEPGHPGLGDRIQESRRTFQPGLWARIVVFAVVLLYLILFVVLNSRQVKVKFVVTSTRVSLIWVIVLSLLIGLILGVLASQVRRFRSHRRHAAREQARSS